jgi:hypothetical protein
MKSKFHPAGVYDVVQHHRNATKRPQSFNITKKNTVFLF